MRLALSKKNAFVSCNGPKKGYEGRKNIEGVIFFLLKCVFYASFVLIGSWYAMAEKTF